MNQNLIEQLVNIRRELHQHPELSNQEFETTKKLKQWLTQANIRLLDLPIHTGVVAEIGNAGGPVVALRADIDALPIMEESGVEFRSRYNQKMHACGHDFHTAVLLGAAWQLKAIEDTLPGKIRLLFQPAEESCDGAQALIAAGALKDVNVIFGLHNAPELPVGEFGTRTGALSANVDRFEITLTGVGAHAGRPENGIDVIVIAAQLILALQTIASRNIGALDSVVLSVTKVIAGNTWNVLPEKIELEGTVRTHCTEIRQQIPTKMGQLIDGITNAMGATAEFRWYAGPPSVINVGHWADFTKKIAKEFGYIVHDIPPQMGGEDFAYYLDHVPGAFINIGTASPYSLHHPKFNIDESALYPASQYYALLAQRALAELNTPITSSLT